MPRIRLQDVITEEPERAELSEADFIDLELTLTDVEDSIRLARKQEDE